MLAEIEQSLRDRKYSSIAGWISDVQYHIYNWCWMEELLPVGKSQILQWLKEARTFLVDEDDKEAALEHLKDLMEFFEGSLSPPQMEP